MKKGLLFSPSLSLIQPTLLNVVRERGQWFETCLSYNPAIHRTKQAQFHAAIVSDLNKHPVAPPHSELLKYFEPPRRVVKRAKEAVAAAKEAFAIKEGKSV